MEKGKTISSKVLPIYMEMHWNSKKYPFASALSSPFIWHISDTWVYSFFKQFVYFYIFQNFVNSSNFKAHTRIKAQWYVTRFLTPTFEFD